MSIKTLYISHQNYDWKKHHCSWLNHGNIQKVIDLPSETDYKTTLEDLGYTNIDLAVNSARTVELVNFDFLNYDDNNFAMHGRLLNALQKKTKSRLIDIDTNWLQVPTRNGLSMLWTAGCSITEATDVNLEDTWRYQLGKKLDRKVLNLSKGGTSIWWSADQILRSDIRSGDIVVWGLTNVARIEYSKNWNMVSNTIISYQEECPQLWTPDYFESETQTLFCLRSIHQVINFCNKIGASLYIVNMLDLNWVSSLLQSYPKFLDLVEEVKEGYLVKFVDYAQDQLHPGPEQHKYFANKIYQFIKEKHYGNQTL